MEKKTEEKAPEKQGFFKRILTNVRALRLQNKRNKDARQMVKLTKLAKTYGLTMVKIVSRGGATYIETHNGQLLRIGSGRK